MGSPKAAGGFGGANGVTAEAKANAQDRLARTTQALQAIEAMQTAARKAALIAPNNLGLDPIIPDNRCRTFPTG